MSHEVENPPGSVGEEGRSINEDDARMLRIQAGEKQAFEELVQRFRGELYGFFMRNLRDAHQSEDLVQETLLRIYNQAWNYLPRGRFRGWLYRVARNLMIDSIRKFSHDALVKSVTRGPEDEDKLLDWIEGEFTSPEEKAERTELAAVVDELIREIPSDQGLTFTLYHYSELSLPEISEIMETALPTCKSRLRLAREKLSEKLRLRGYSDPGDPDDEDEFDL